MNIDTQHLCPATGGPVAPVLRLTNTRSSRVLLIDGDRRRSYRLWASFGAFSGGDTIAAVESADEALALIHPPPSRLVLVALSLGEGHGLELRRRLKSRPDPVAVLAYHHDFDGLLAGGALIAGADGALSAPTTAEQLLEIARRAVGHERSFWAPPPGAFPDVATHVDDRDRPLVAMLREAAHPKDIAEQLDISGRALRLRHAAIIDRLDSALAARLGAPGCSPPARSRIIRTVKPPSVQQRRVAAAPRLAGGPLRAPRHPVHADRDEGARRDHHKPGSAPPVVVALVVSRRTTNLKQSPAPRTAAPPHRGSRGEQNPLSRRKQYHHVLLAVAAKSGDRWSDQSPRNPAWVRHAACDRLEA